MATKHHQILTTNLNHKDQHQLAAYESRGGYQAVRKALKMDPAAIIAEVKASGLRGRGGCWFSNGGEVGLCSKEFRKANLSFKQCR